MKAGQITAKLRDAVPVHFFADGEDRIQYKNIEIPDSLKTLEIKDFGFDVSEEGKISFRLFFDKGILPAEFPPARPMVTRVAKAAAKAAKTTETATEEVATEEAEEATSDDETVEEVGNAEDAIDIPELPGLTETRFAVTGSRRKELVAAISAYIKQQAIYLGAPGFTFAIGDYRIDKTGTLVGEPTPELLAALAEQGFTPEKSDAA